MARFRSLILIITGAGILLLSLSNSRGVSYALGVRDTIKADSALWPRTFGFGRPATAAEITAWDIDVRPDGKGLPPGTGTAGDGKSIYMIKCAACHGADGREKPGVKLPAPALVSDTIVVGRKTNTIGNYWPYATTVFDYIRRSMPYNAPGSLTDKEVYGLTAYLLNANRIIDVNAQLNAETLPKVVMPAKKFYIMDNRRGGSEIK